LSPIISRARTSIYLRAAFVGTEQWRWRWRRVVEVEGVVGIFNIHLYFATNRMVKLPGMIWTEALLRINE
jgi:hypothetical protein